MQELEGIHSKRKIWGKILQKTKVFSKGRKTITFER